MQDLTLDTEPARWQRPPSQATLALSGHLPASADLSLAALAALPRRELGPTQVNCFTGRPVANVRSLAGACLLDVLDAAGFSTQPRSQLKRCIVMGLGTDGYRAMFSWAELYNSDIGAGVLVLYERDGVPLDSTLGPLALISSNDRQLGPRHLRGLQGVHVQIL